MLQKFLLIPLDIFLENQHNKNISNRLDAWLLFFASDDPEDIIRLVEEYPEFQAIYEQAYQICRNLENVMGIFSEELRILDRNTVQLMIDEMQETLNETKAELDSAKADLDSTKADLGSAKADLDSAKADLDSTKADLDSAKEELQKTSRERDALLARLQQFECGNKN